MKGVGFISKIFSIVVSIICQARAVLKGRIADFNQLIRENDLRKRAATAEGAGSDDSD